MNEKVFLVVNILKIPFRFLLVPNRTHTKSYISLNNIHLQSRLNYISEYGAVVTKESARHLEHRPIKIFNRDSKPIQKLDFQLLKHNLFLDSDEADEQKIKSLLKAQNSIVFYTPSTIYSLLDSSRSNIKSDVNHTREIDENRKTNKDYSIPGYKYLLLSLLLKLSKNVELIYEYSEVSRAPVYVHFMIHLPLIISTMIIFLIILSFETGINENIIEQEISKLPLQKYEKRLGFCDCSVCLEPFEENALVRVLNCNHCFHQNCIDSWLKTMLKCPICRNSVSKLADSPRYQIYQSINTI